MKASMIATNYFTAQLNELHISHVGQLQELNGTIETQAKTIGSQERTIDDMSATISGLRKQVISLDTELQSFKTTASAKAGSKFEGNINAEAAKEEPATEDAYKDDCGCPSCQINRIIKQAKANGEVDEPSEETKAKIDAIKKGAIGSILGSILSKIGNVDVEIVEVKS